MIKYIICSIVGTFILVIISVLIKNISYKKLFKKADINSYEVQCKNYIKKMLMYIKISYIYHYVYNTFFVSCIVSIIYFIWIMPDIGIYLELIFYIIAGIELLYMIMSLPELKYKNKYMENAYKEDINQTTLLVAFGGSDIETKLVTLEKLINHAKSKFDEENILISYNFKNNCNQNVVKKLKSLGVRYVCLPMPSKSYSIAWTSKYYVKTKNVMLIDDDVFLPENIIIPNTNSVDIWGYMICAEKPDQNANWLSKCIVYCQDIEYRFAGLIKMLQSLPTNSSAMTHHGAISMYKKDVLDDIMAKHDCVFDGEDYLMGILAYFNGYNLKMVKDQYIPTMVPSSIYTLFRQRVMSWDYVILKFLNYNIGILLKPDFNNIMVKISAFFHIWTIYQDFIRIPNIIILSLYFQTYKWLIIYISISIFAKSVAILFVLYIRNSINSTEIPIKYGLGLIIAFPIYTFITFLFRLIAQVRYLFIFDQRIHHNIKFEDRPCIPNNGNYIKHEDWVMNNIPYTITECDEYNDLTNGESYFLQNENDRIIWDTYVNQMKHMYQNDLWWDYLQ